MQTMASGDDVFVVFISLSSLELNTCWETVGCDAITRSKVQSSKN